MKKSKACKGEEREGEGERGQREGLGLGRVRVAEGKWGGEREHASGHAHAEKKATRAG